MPSWNLENIFFVGAQTGKHLLRKQNFFKEIRKNFIVLSKARKVSATNVSCVCKMGNIEGKHFFVVFVSATVFPRFRAPKEIFFPCFVTQKLGLE